jgi:iron complex outermembrane recepter protein
MIAGAGAAGAAAEPTHPLAVPQSGQQMGAAATSSEAAATELPEVQVTDTKEQKARQGSAESGYRYTDADLGPLGARKVLDTPFSIQAVSSELLRNQGAETFSEAVKYLPSVYTEGHFGLEFGPPVIRGIQGDDNAQSVRIDGLNVRADTALPLELYEKLEVLYGPAASLYGPSPAAGMVNSVLKRPTDTPLREIALEYGTRGNVQGRADLAGRLGGAGWFGYRVNLLRADGESYTPGSNLSRTLGSVALDFHVTDSTLLQLSANHYEFDQKGFPGAFSYSSATGLPAAPDPTKAGYGQNFAGVNATTNMTELRISQALGPNWNLSGAVLNQIAQRQFHDTITNSFSDADGAYKTNYRQSGSQADVLSNNFYLNGRVDTGALRHDIALGSVGYLTDAYTVPGLLPGANSLLLGTGSLANPVSLPEPVWGGTGTRYKSSHTGIQSLVLSDTLGWGDHWSTLLAANDSWISTKNYSQSGATTSSYEKNGTWSYSASLLFKPYSISTIYLTYANSVQPGANAPTTAANASQALAPYRSSEWELGAKTSLARLDLTAALFQIRRPFAFTDSDGVFKTDGEQQNRGLEVTARGEAAAGLMIFGSLTWLDPRMNSTSSPATEGNLVVGVPRLQANLLAEYRLPCLSGAVLEGDLHYTGKRAANSENTAWAAGYTTLDLGTRYELRMGTTLLTTRLMVANVTDTNYWASLYTGTGWTGDPTGTGTGTAFLGEPRTVKLTATLAF